MDLQSANAMNSNQRGYDYMTYSSPTVGMEVSHQLYGSGKVTRFNAKDQTCTVMLDRGFQVECIANNGRIC